MADLNEKQKRFCVEYIKDLNGTKAYLRAYPDSSEESARSSAATFLANPNIQEEISKIKQARSKRVNISQDRVLKELANIAFCDIGLIADFDGDGRLVLKTKEEMKGAIKSIHSLSQDEIYDRDGNLLRIKNKFTMHDKIKALELLCKHLGILDGNGSDDKPGKDNAEKRFADALDRVTERIRKRGAKS